MRDAAKGMTLEKVKQFYKMKDRNQYKAFFEGVFEKSGTELSARETIVIDYHVFSMTYPPTLFFFNIRS